ncbi:MAG: amino acid adenylation domain-containing protein [Gemmatimonadota bacterium]
MSPAASQTAGALREPRTSGTHAASGTLAALLRSAAQLHARNVAVEEAPGHGIDYAELDRLSDRFAERLRELGVGAGQRVGLCLPKSVDAVAAIWAVLKSGAAYVPVDAAGPLRRAAFVLHDCGVRVVVVEESLAEALSAEIEALGGAPARIELPRSGAGRGLAETLARDDGVTRAGPAGEYPGPDDLAYVLYTSGSTGRPKGVMLTHRNATSFLDWCSETLRPGPEDRFSSHAPLHFDLSILDLFLAAKHGATVALVSEDDAKDPRRLAAWIADRRISIWYSTPSVLGLLAQHGRLQQHDLSSVRTVLFAGEVFPVKHLRLLKTLVPRPRYVNLYGPTETNVCTWYEIPRDIPPQRVEPYPIGRACSHLRTRVVDPSGADVASGTEGELCVAGPAVMRGYWNLPDRTARAFLRDPEGTLWYRTGDVVHEDRAGDYVFVGRRDRMVKRRGHRIELGEIEAGLYRHPDVREAAVVALPDGDGGVRIKAWLSCHGGRRPSLIELKGFCAENLPRSMAPDAFAFLEALPRTSTDKVDYERLWTSA